MSPVAVAGVTGATGLALGANSSCALIADGTVRCWGAGKAWGDGVLRTAAPPAPVARREGRRADRRGRASHLRAARQRQDHLLGQRGRPAAACGRERPPRRRRGRGVGRGGACVRAHERRHRALLGRLAVERPGRTVARAAEARGRRRDHDGRLDGVRAPRWRERELLGAQRSGRARSRSRQRLARRPRDRAGRRRRARHLGRGAHLRRPPRRHRAMLGLGRRRRARSRACRADRSRRVPCRASSTSSSSRSAPTTRARSVARASSGAGAATPPASSETARPSAARVPRASPGRARGRRREQAPRCLASGVVKKPGGGGVHALSAYLVLSAGPSSRVFRVRGPGDAPSIEELPSATTLDVP